MTRTWPESAPNPHDYSYLMFTPDVDADTAARRFRDKYGQHPDHIVDHLGNLYVGPVPERRSDE
jgi:hypothetical protein